MALRRAVCRAAYRALDQSIQRSVCTISSLSNKENSYYDRSSCSSLWRYAGFAAGLSFGIAACSDHDRPINEDSINPIDARKELPRPLQLVFSQVNQQLVIIHFND